jgi:hypothetical protein
MRKLPKKVPKIHVTFDEPRNGYWNGGVRSGGVFSPRPTLNNQIEWGSMGLNYWFRLGFGRSWKHAASIAKNVIKRNLSVPATVEVIWE